MALSLRALVAPLDHLTADATPAWGQMTPQHMVEHLGLLAALSYGRITSPVAPPEAKWDRRQAALWSDTPFPRNFDPFKGGTLPKLRYADMDAARAKLLDHVARYEAHWTAHPDATHVHPYFGRLRRDGWARFHDKHVRHHLAQFDLLAHLDAA
ncbi:MAG: DUF1569 domain-containing protein [Bacteroidota bacterium]